MPHIINAGISGVDVRSTENSWADLELPEPYEKIIELLCPDSTPREIQTLALAGFGILQSRRNLIVSAPTNSGKSLIGTLILIEAVLNGKRAVLIEPLRSLAKEKASELVSIKSQLESVLGFAIKIQLTTGDYRLNRETFDAPPPNKGEIIVATPERFESILRQTDFDLWTDSIGAICVDEAHLLSSRHRGPTIEYLLTHSLGLPNPPRLALLSATVGNTEKVRDWLAPCDLIQSTTRFPSLSKEVWEIAEDENPEDLISSWVENQLANKNQSLLIFVYQTRTADKLASTLNSRLNGDSQIAHSYHSQMSQRKRDSVRESFASGECRCLVSTTALSLGVNFPATKVLVKDIFFQNGKPLKHWELLQMLGRAGRNKTPGKGIVFVSATANFSAKALALELNNEELPDLESPYRVFFRNEPSDRESAVIQLATRIGVLILRSGDDGIKLHNLKKYLERSLDGDKLIGHLPAALDWMCDSFRVLAYLEEGKYRVTTLGALSLKSSLPLDVGSGVAQILKDLLYLDEPLSLIKKMNPLDYLLLLNLIRGLSIRSSLGKQKLRDKLDMWMEQNSSNCSLLYTNWLARQKSDEVWGSLGLNGQTRTFGSKGIEERSINACLLSVVMFERSRGKTVDELETQWGISNLSGKDEKFRDELLWLLHGIGQVLDIKTFYFFLKSQCEFTDRQIKDTKDVLRSHKRMILELMKNLRNCSSLGHLMLDIRKVIGPSKGQLIGPGTIRKLEEHGFRDVMDLANTPKEDLIGLGIRRRFAEQIQSYFEKRRG